MFPCWVTLLGKSPVGSRSVRVSPSGETRKTVTLSLPALVTNSHFLSLLNCTEWDDPRPSPAKRTDGPEPSPPVSKRPATVSVPLLWRSYITTSFAGSAWPCVLLWFVATKTAPVTDKNMRLSSGSANAARGQPPPGGEARTTESIATAIGEPWRGDWPRGVVDNMS